MERQVEDVESARDFIANLSVPVEGGLESFTDQKLLSEPDFKAPGPMSVAVGSQIASFSETVNANLRPLITNAFLLAQLAADKRLETGDANSVDWYETYTSTLGRIGFVDEASDMAFRSIQGSHLEVYQEITGVLTTLLGPAASLSASVLAVLNGLATMSKETPWITLFQSRSQRAHANQFQISHASTDKDATRVTLFGFELNAHRSVTQVLFFRLENAGATLRKFTRTLTLNEEVLEGTAKLIADKLARRTKQYVAAIEF